VIQQELARAGRHGRKSGIGFHDYRDGVEAAELNVVQPGSELPHVAFGADAGPLAGLARRLAQAGLSVESDVGLRPGSMAVGTTWVQLTDGRTAAQVADEEHRPVLLLDLARDYESATLLGVAVSPAARTALPALAAALEPAGIRLVELDDVAGLIVMRTVACIANEAADLITWAGVEGAQIDTAMKLATAYPLGPLEWGDRLGPARLWQLLGHLQAHYGDPRYRRSPWLSRAHFTGGSLRG
jgi:3-hydroxybutyryl-CoA dehydrogenase